MNNFEKVFNQTLHNEGGLVDHKVLHDNGGRTYAGITQKWHPSWCGWDALRNGATAEQMLEHVSQFYYDEYYTKLQLHSLPLHIASVIFDTAVNVGKRTAVKMAQRVVETAADGIIGPLTIAAIKSNVNFTEQFTLERIRFYNKIASSPNQLTFIRGWLNRALSYIPTKKAA